MGEEGLTRRRRRPILGTRVPVIKCVRPRALSYLVAVPIPRLDRRGKPVATEILEKAIKAIIREMAVLFGGAKLLRSPGAYRMLDGRVIMDDDEPVAISFTDRRTFRRRRRALSKLAASAGTALDQESMAVLGCPAEGLIVFTEDRG